jgi:two-component sensor histidine kinase
MLELEWREIGGPPVASPVVRGFGSRLIERSLTGEARGTAELIFNPDGLVCRLSAELDSNVASSAGPPS